MNFYQSTLKWKHKDLFAFSDHSLLSGTLISLILGPRWYHHCFIIPQHTPVIFLSSQLRLERHNHLHIPTPPLASLASSGLICSPSESQLSPAAVPALAGLSATRERLTVMPTGLPLIHGHNLRSISAAWKSCHPSQVNVCSGFNYCNLFFSPQPPAPPSPSSADVLVSYFL